jgi:hypothetical protein
MPLTRHFSPPLYHLLHRSLFLFIVTNYIFVPYSSLLRHEYISFLILIIADCRFIILFLLPLYAYSLVPLIVTDYVSLLLFIITHFIFFFFSLSHTVSAIIFIVITNCALFIAKYFYFPPICHRH